MERRDVHLVHTRPHELGDAFLHFTRRLIGKGHGEYLMRFGQTLGEDIGETARKYTGLSRACPGDNEQGAVGGGDRLALAVVEIIE